MSLKVAVLLCIAFSVVFGLVLLRWGYKYRTELEEQKDDLDINEDATPPRTMRSVEEEARAALRAELLAQRTREISAAEDRRRKKPQFP